MIGQIIFSLALILNPFDYLPADGRCLKINEYQELANILHDGDNWPYGKCNDYEFRLPDFKSNIPNSVPYIRVK